MNRRLWNVLVPEPTCSLHSPQFWALLLPTLALCVYSGFKENVSKDIPSLLNQDKIKHNQIVHNNLI
ncbi:hypothetical protein TpMuguga_03g02200 [Theileria parva strain Muguga]|uniref:uncharacterized protein n=1 Tax=Theileria parva strain Muguga TaxID=333668 RepID=UPI001C61A956|nr:uncharacterized protein TpMuguga_03g02200 [Theileria parva strain Muguga]KAF5153160.1 hypothetical protein TpMuguga_03g02200 [Theileria parva strain Muguga]